MSKKNRKKKLQKNSSRLNQNRPADSRNMTVGKLLDDLLACNTDCYRGFCTTTFEDDADRIDYYIKNLPTLPYVTDQFINYMFSNGLKAGSEEDNAKLNNFLYKNNIQGIPNYIVIQEAMRGALIRGKCGIRWLSDEDGIINVPWNQYITITDVDKEYYGFRKPIAYALGTDPDVKNPLGLKEIKLDESEFKSTGQLLSLNKDILICPPEDFVNVRGDVTTENGVSRLCRDKQRLDVLASVYERLNYDIEYDGPGRLIFWLKDSILTGNPSMDLSTGEILDSSVTSREAQAERARAEVRKLGEEIKNSRSDNVILASSIFNKMDHLPRVTKATEFFGYLESEGAILCQTLGIVPELIGFGKVSGNVSMDKIIDNAMVNTIIPLREAYASQFSPFLSHHLGIEKVYFDKYELQSRIDRSDKIYKLALSISQLDSQGRREVADYLEERIYESI